MMKQLLSLLLMIFLLIAPASAESPAADRPETGVLVSLEQSGIYAGRSATVTCTVRYGADVMDVIRLYDHTDRLLEEIVNDGSGLVELQLRLRPYAVGEGYIYARSGDFESERAYFTVQSTSSVSAEMIDTLESVCTDIVAALEAQNITDGESAEAKSIVLALLAGDGRIESYGENNGNILFRTTDGLMGCYGFHVTEQGVMGSDGPFVPLEDIYRMYTEGSLTDSTLAASEIPITNGHIRLIAPDITDPTMHYCYVSYQPHLQVMSLQQQFTYTPQTGPAAIDALITGDMTDCGLLILLGHGGRLLTEGGNMYVMLLDFLSDEQLAAVADYLWEPAEVGHFTARHRHTDKEDPDGESYYINDDSMHLIFDVRQDADGKFRFYMAATRNFFDAVLEGKTFDNTVVFLASCYGANDPVLREILLDRGASAVISTVDWMPDLMSTLMVSNLNQMTVEREDGTHLALQDAVDTLPSFLTDERLLQYYNQLLSLEFINESETPQDEYIQNKKKLMDEHFDRNPMIVYTRTGKTADRAWYGAGDLTVTVLDEFGRPIPDAEITIYRWFEHTFHRITDEETVLKTDQDGRYFLSGIPYGEYCVTADKDGLTGEAAVTVDDSFVEAPAIILSPLTMFYDYLRDVVVPEIGLAPEASFTGPQTHYPTPWEVQWEDVISRTKGLFSAAVNDFDFDGKYEMLTVTIPERNAEQMLDDDIYTAFDLRLYQIIDGKVQQTDYLPNALKMSGKNSLEQDNMRVHLVTWDKTTYIFTRSFFTSGNSYDGADSAHLIIQDGKLVQSDYLPVLQYNFTAPDGSSYHTVNNLNDVYATKAELAALNPGDVLCGWNFDFYERYYNPSRNRYETTGSYIGRADDYTHLHAIINREMQPVLYTPMVLTASPVPTKAPEELAAEAMIAQRKDAVIASVSAVAPDPNYDASRYSVTVSSYKTGKMSQLMIFGPGYGDPAVLMAKFIAAINTPELGLDADTIAALSAFDYENEWNMNVNGYSLALGGTPSGDDVVNLIWPD